MGHRKLGSIAGIASGFALMAGVMFGAGGSTVSAQDMAMASHPAHIHAGDCTTLGEVVFPLSDVGASMSMNATPMAMGAMMGQMSSIAVEASVTTVPAALADIVAGNHAINVHESAENIGNYIACGAIGGTMMGTSDLAIGLAPLNDSGYSGIAILHDNGDGTTMVSVFLTNSSGMMMDGGMMATPTS